MSRNQEIYDKLGREREVQNWGQMFGHSNPDANGPNMCIAAARFLVARMSGLVPEFGVHLNDFLHSPAAKQLAPAIGLVRHKYLWGDPKHAFDVNVVDEFNRLVMPALLSWGQRKKGADIKFVTLKNAPCHKGDALLNSGTPLVVGVHYRHSNSRSVGWNNHYVTIVQASSHDVWVVDSWGSDPVNAVLRIDKIVAFSFGTPLRVSLPVDGLTQSTIIPGKNQFFGYFAESGTPLKLSMAL